MKFKSAFIALVFAALAPLQAQVPQLINYQGRVAVGAVNFDGSGQFKFALVDTAGNSTYWSNDGTSTAGSEPTTAVTLTVSKGLYSVLLGDATLPNMAIVSSTVFTNPDVRLRVWFNDGTNGFQLLAPDQRIAAVGYAMVAGSVPDGAITSTKIAAGAVDSSHLSANVTGSFTPPGVVVAYDGKIMLCCLDFNAKYNLGNINDGFKKITNNQFRKLIKKQFYKQKLSTCRDCSMFYLPSEEVLKNTGDLIKKINNEKISNTKLIFRYM